MKQEVWYLLRPPFGNVICVANQVVLCYGLKLASRYVGSDTWEGLLCRPRSAAASDWPMAVC